MAGRSISQTPEKTNTVWLTFFKLSNTSHMCLLKEVTLQTCSVCFQQMMKVDCSNSHWCDIFLKKPIYLWYISVWEMLEAANLKDHPQESFSSMYFTLSPLLYTSVSERRVNYDSTLRKIWWKCTQTTWYKVARSLQRAKTDYETYQNIHMLYIIYNDDPPGIPPTEALLKMMFLSPWRDICDRSLER